VFAHELLITHRDNMVFKKTRCEKYY